MTHVRGAASVAVACLCIRFICLLKAWVTIAECSSPVVDYRWARAGSNRIIHRVIKTKSGLETNKKEESTWNIFFPFVGLAFYTGLWDPVQPSAQVTAPLLTDKVGLTRACPRLRRWGATSFSKLCVITMALWRTPCPGEGTCGAECRQNRLWGNRAMRWMGVVAVYMSLMLLHHSWQHQKQFAK